VSLSSHLLAKNSPVRKFIADHYPNTRALAVPDPHASPHELKVPGRDAVVVQPLLRADAGVAKILPADAERYPWATVGTAVDYRLRYCLEAAPVRTLVAHYGAHKLSMLLTGRREAPVAFQELARALGDVVPEGARTGDLLSMDAEDRLARLCYVLALYEQCYRAPMMRDWPVVRLGDHASLKDLLALCEDRVALDIQALSARFLVGGRELMDAGNLALNPTFGGSVPLGGADADFVCDGCLIDIKTTKDTKPRRPEFWQLVGYTLADWDDCFRLVEVGLYYSRQGVILRWPVEEFLNALAGRPVDLACQRAEFREVLTACGERGGA